MFHTETLCCLYREYTISIEQKYCFFKTETLFFLTEILSFENRKHVSACQIWVKIMEFGPNQVHMAPFELILIRFGSHMVRDASGMPHGATGAPWGTKGTQGGPSGLRPVKPTVPATPNSETSNSGTRISDLPRGLGVVGGL